MDALWGGLPSVSSWTFDPHALDVAPRHCDARSYAPTLNVVAMLVSETLNTSRVFSVNDNITSNAALITEAQILAHERADTFVNLMMYHVKLDYLSMSPHMAAFAVELFRVHRRVIGPYMSGPMYDAYFHMADLLHDIVRASRDLSGFGY